MSKKGKTQHDVIPISERFSCWRDKYQWMLYDFHESRFNNKGELKILPSPTFHPKLSQLVDFMVESLTKEEAESLKNIVVSVNTHKYQIYTYLQKTLAPIVITPADAAEQFKQTEE